jgi:hypothetical protein
MRDHPWIKVLLAPQAVKLQHLAIAILTEAAIGIGMVVVE